MQADISEDLKASTGMGNFFMLFLNVWRTSVSELTFARYHTVMVNFPDGAYRNLRITLIYLIWVFQVVLMLIIMLNFIIAIVDRSYTQVQGEKRIHVYWNKAELNQECYQLMKYYY